MIGKIFQIQHGFILVEKLDTLDKGSDDPRTGTPIVDGQVYDTKYDDIYQGWERVEQLDTGFVPTRIREELELASELAAKARALQIGRHNENRN